MSLTVSSKAPAVRSLAPLTRLTMTFRELSIEGRKDWRHWVIFAQHAADEGDADMVKVMECYHGLKKRERQTATPEFVADLAGVSPNDLAAEVFRSYLSYASDASNLIEAAGRPEIVRRQVEFAKKEAGWRDRKMLHEHSGFLPQKQGGGIHVNAQANAETQTATIVQAPELPTMESDTLRFTRTLKDTVSISDGQRKLSPPPVPALRGEERTEQ